MDNLENPYLKRVEILENQLEKKIEELRKERECNKEAMKYIFYLVGMLGGRAEISLSGLSDQNRELKCRIDKENGVVVLRIGSEPKKKHARELSEEPVQMNIYEFPEYLPDKGD